MRGGHSAARRVPRNATARGARTLRRARRTQRRANGQGGEGGARRPQLRAACRATQPPAAAAPAQTRKGAGANTQWETNAPGNRWGTHRWEMHTDVQ